MRIVSLLPAATEICFALGLGGSLVGVSPECDYPPAARDIPALSRVLLDYEDKSSAETSRMVGEQLESGAALYQVDEAALQEASPDLVLTQGLCEVCAPSLGNVQAAARRLPKPPMLVSLDPHRLEDVLGDIEKVGQAAAAIESAGALVASLRERIRAVEVRADRTKTRPRVLCLEWFDPLFAAGHWVPEMVRLAGGRDVFANVGERSERLDPKRIQMMAPEVVVLMPCGFHMDRTRSDAPLVEKIPGWKDLPAVRREQVWLVDGSSYFNRPGPRLVDGLEILAHILHPESFPGTWPSKDVQQWVG